MYDWTGSRIQADALTVPCTFCGAGIDERCHAKGNPGHLLEAFPAHDVRTRAGQKKANA